MDAEQTLEVAQRVLEALEESAEAQEAAENAISRATDDISATEGYLTQVLAQIFLSFYKSRSCFYF